MIEILNAVTCLTGITGAILVGEKNRLGFLLFIISSISMLMLGCIRLDYGVMILQSVFIGIDMYYFYRWGK